MNTAFDPLWNVPVSKRVGEFIAECGVPIVKVPHYWVPRWAAAVADAECSEETRRWALARGAQDPEFVDAIDTIRVLTDGGKGPEKAQARRRLAEFLVEAWPGPISAKGKNESKEPR